EEIRRWGEARDFGFEPRDHLDIGATLGWFEQDRGADVSGSRFVYRMGDAALIELALYRFALDRLVAKGFVPVLPPVLVRERARSAAGARRATSASSRATISTSGPHSAGSSRIAAPTSRARGSSIGWATRR